MTKLLLSIVLLTSCSLLKRDEKNEILKKYPVTIQGYGNKLFYESEKASHTIQFSFQHVFHRILSNAEKGEDNLIKQQATQMSKNVSNLLWKVVECDLYKKKELGKTYCEAQEAKELISEAAKIESLNNDKLLWPNLSPAQILAEIDGTLLKKKKNATEEIESHFLKIDFISDFKELVSDQFGISSVYCTKTGVAFKTYKCFLN